MGIITLISFIAIVGGIALIIQSIQGRQRSLGGVGGTLAIAGVVLLIISRSLIVVPEGRVGVVFNVFSGTQENELSPGLNFVLPFIQQVTFYNTREQTLDFVRDNGEAIESRSEEGLDIGIDATIRFRIEASESDNVFRELGRDWTQGSDFALSYQGTLVRPQVRSIIRNSVANYKAADLISSQRSALQGEIRTTLGEELAKSHIELIDVLLRDIRIPESVKVKIEEKQAAEQAIEIAENQKKQAEIDAQRAKTVAEGQRDAEIAAAEGRARARELEAEAEAKAITLQGEAIRVNPEIIQFEIAQRLSPTIQTIMIPSDGNYLLDIGALTGRKATPAPSSSPPSQ